MKYLLPNVIARLYLSIAAASLLLLSLAQPAWAGFTVSNGTVTDAVTSLVWDQCPQGLSTTTTACDTGSASTFSTWADALKAAVTANATSGGYKGFSDWRLPNVKELESIAKLDQYGPAIDTTAFPGTPPSGFWTSTNYAPHGEWVWSVNFKYGTSVTDYKTKTAPPYSLSPNYVRLVRSGQFLAKLDSLSPTVTVTSISPSSGPTAGGTGVTITGTGFVSGATVTIGGTAATNVVFGSATSLTATTPALSAGAKDVVVTNPDTQTGTLTNGFTYAAAPTVSSISPSSGPIAGGTSVTITGTNLSSVTYVSVGGEACTALSANTSTSITCTTPLRAVGASDVRVTTAGGTNAVNTLYTYLAAPAVSSIDPLLGPVAGRTTVTITGTGFTGATAVKFGSANASGYTVNSATQITATSPAAAAATVDVTVVTAGGTSATSSGDHFLYIAAPTVTSISPSSGPTAGGTSVTITGTNLNSLNGVTIGGLAGFDWTSRTSAADNSWSGVTYGNGLFVAVSYDGASRVTTSADGITWTPRTAAADSTWQSVTYGMVNGSGLFVAVADSGTSRVMTSPDGITWTPHTAAAASAWRSVTYGNGLFVAVALDGGTYRVMTSPDGITWAPQTAAAASAWRSVTYGMVNGQGLFVAVAASGTDQVMTSPNGINWTSRTAAAANTWVDVIYGNGLFVAVATAGSANRVMTSPDAVTWTSRASAAENWWQSVTYGNGLFVAVSFDGASRVMTSPDGNNWTSQAAAAANGWTKVTYGNGLFVAVAPTGSGNRVMTSSRSVAATVTSSSDTSITATTPPGIAGTASVRVTTSGGTSAANSLYTYVVVPAPTVTSISPSSGPTAGGSSVTITGTGFTGATGVTIGPQAGINWTSQAAAAANTWASVTYGMVNGQGLFVAVAASGTDQVMTSPDGITWTSRTSPAGNAPVSVTYGNGRFVAVGAGCTQSDTGKCVMFSADGIHWGQSPAPADAWRSVTYGNGLFVAVATDGTVMTSPDGFDWTSQASAPANVWQSVTYGEVGGQGLFVAVATNGSGNRVMTSPDGIAWTSRTSAADEAWQSVTYGNGLFVAVATTGSGNDVMTSPDGVTWTSRASAVGNLWMGVSYGNGLFVAVGYVVVGDGAGSRLMTSPDGITWTSRTYASDNAWFGVTYGNGRFVAVAYFGNGNRVMTSGPPAATNVLVVSGTSITATTPPGAAGTASVLVTTAAGTNAANTLYTYGAPATYSVTYNGNTSTGGSVPTDGGAYANGATVTVLGNTGTLVRTGYTFNGWNTLANGTGASYAPTATFAIAANATLYAQWTALPYVPPVTPPEVVLVTPIPTVTSGTATVAPGGTVTVAGAAQVTASGGSTVNLGDAAVGATLSIPATTGGQPVTVNIGGQLLTINNTGGAPASFTVRRVVGADGTVQTVLVVDPPTTGAQPVISITSNAPAGQVLVAITVPGVQGGLLEVISQGGPAGVVIDSTRRDGTGVVDGYQISLTLGRASLPVTRRPQPSRAARAIAAPESLIIYAGERAYFDSEGYFLALRLESSAGNAAGDPLALRLPVNLTLSGSVPKLDAMVTRLGKTLQQALLDVAGATRVMDSATGQPVASALGVLPLELGTVRLYTLPLGPVDIDTRRADGVALTDSGLAAITVSGVTVNLAPSVKSLEKLASDVATALPGATVAVRADGVIAVTVQGTTYVMRAGWVSQQTPVQTPAAPAFDSDAAGQMRYRQLDTDLLERAFTLTPAFGDFASLSATLQQALPGSTVQTNPDGTVRLMLTQAGLEQHWTLTPSVALEAAPSGTAPWWQQSDGSLGLRNSDGTAQTFGVR